MSLLTTVWLADIAANLFADNTFMAQAVDDSPFVSNRTVVRPNAGAKPTVERNRTVLPATITKRTDSDGSYDIQEFTSDPTLITDIEEVETSYNKRQSVLREHNETLNEQIGNYLPTVWCPTAAVAASQIITTTGANRVGNAPGATGNRKALTKDDVRRIRAIFDAQNIPNEGRFILLDAAMYNDLLFDSQLLSREYMDTPNLETGSVGRLFGFEVYVRSNVARMAIGNEAAKAPEAANAATDNALALAWHRGAVARALGEIKVFADENKPEYYGSIFSALVRAGGATYYKNQKGVAAIVEAAAS